jgi:hypothetical protein
METIIPPREHQKHPHDDRLIELSSQALAENLRHHPSSSSSDDRSKRIPEQWTNEIRFEIRHRRRLAAIDTDEAKMPMDCDDHAFSSVSKFEESSLVLSEDEIVHVAQQQGILLAQNAPSSSLLPPLLDPKTTQRSLLLPFTSSSATFVTWDNVMALDNPIQVLHHQIEYLDDLLPDWQEHGRVFFQNGLQHEHDWPRVVELHRIWFDKSRNNTIEYRALQLDLCENLVQQVTQQQQQQQQQNVPPPPAMVAGEDRRQWLVDLAVRMFTDWMIRGIYVRDDGDRRVWNIGSTLWGWLIRMKNNKDYNDDDDDDLATILIRADVQATWFSAWLAHLSPDQSRSLMQDANQKHSNTLATSLDMCHRHLVNPERTDMDREACCFWLTVLKSLLMSTRVSLFPWDSLSFLTTENVEERQWFVFNLYEMNMQVEENNQSKRDPQGNETNNTINATATSILMCADAMETILWGCRDSCYYAQMLTKVTDLERACENESPCRLLLRGIVARLQRD